MPNRLHFPPVVAMPLAAPIAPTPALTLKYILSQLTKTKLIIINTVLPLCLIDAMLNPTAPLTKLVIPYLSYRPLIFGSIFLSNMSAAYKINTLFLKKIENTPTLIRCTALPFCMINTIFISKIAIDSYQILIGNLPSLPEWIILFVIPFIYIWSTQFFLDKLRA
jgi:hypothetical protein